MRKLASLREVSLLQPIGGADRIEIAKIDGWQCIVRKGEFRQGDLGVYFEIDSFLPIEDRYEFLRKSSFKRMMEEEGFRLKTVRMRKTLSQGLLLPLNVFPEIDQPEAGMDVTELLGVQLYEKPIPASLQGLAKGDYQPYLRKTDEERIQNLPDYFEEYKGVEFECTVKLDGTSATYFHNNDEFGVCSRNWELKPDENNTYWKIALEMEIENILNDCALNIALHGEIVGEGINKNPEKIGGQKFYLFNVWDIEKRRYMTPRERAGVFGLLKVKSDSPEKINHVPILGDVKIFEECSTMDDILEYAKGPSLNPDIRREGLVFKSTKLVNGQILSFKVVDNEIL